MITDKLSKLREFSSKLDRIPYSTIYNLLKKVDLGQLVGTKIPSNSLIIRARISEKEEFTKVKQLSYKCDPTKYGRANRIKFPVFYGSYTPVTKDNFLNTVVSSYMELIEILRNKEMPVDTKELSLTLGIWKVKSEMPVASIIYDKEYLRKNRHVLGLYDLFLKNCNVKDKLILEFISEEFAKAEINSNNDYKISAAFSELFFEKNYYKIGALLYPSVRAQGESFNVAIRPYFVKRYLQLDSVYTTNVYIKESVFFNDWQKEAIVKSNSDTFELKTMTEKGANLGRIESLKILDSMLKGK